MAKKSSNKDDKRASSTPARSTASPSRSSASSPSRSAADTARQAAQARAFREARAISEQRQRDIQSVRDRTRDTLSRTPAALRNPVVDTVGKIEAAKPAPKKTATRLGRATLKQARTHQLGALTDTKPARDARRSPEKVRAILKCKGRPKNKKSPRRGGGGGGKKRFIPWC